MSVNVSFLIRDGLETDIPACLAVDHTFSTEFVWQVQVERDDPHYYQMTFRTERLPRTLDATYAASEQRMRQCLPDSGCFLVAVEREQDQVMGYCVMSTSPVHRLALLHDLVIDRTYRRNRIGSKLLAIARRWGREQGLARLLVELQTRNYPAIQFCQASGLAFCGYNERYLDQQELAIFFGQSLR
jgi:GNAT superfamily N-acetyltransferase